VEMPAKIISCMDSCTSRKSKVNMAILDRDFYTLVCSSLVLHCSSTFRFRYFRW
jgi:hypothetical protein